MLVIPSENLERGREYKIRKVTDQIKLAQQMSAASVTLDQRSHKQLYAALGIGVLVAREAYQNGYVNEVLVDTVTRLTGKSPNPNKVDLNASVAVQGASTPEMRQKAGKGGRAIAIIRLLPLATSEEIADYIEEQGGIECLLANHRRSKALSPTELVVKCQPELLIEVLSHSGSNLDLQVSIGERFGSERQLVELIRYSASEPPDPFEAAEAESLLINEAAEDDEDDEL